jgi:hypothetical protein
MPKVLAHVTEPVELSVVAFHPMDGEEIFLTYTWEREEGPDIRRTGKGPPYMALIGGQPGQITTHAFGLRLGTWLIRADLRAVELADAKQNLDDARRNHNPAEDINVLEQTLRELEDIRAHDAVFADANSDFEIVGQQGCGDLTMNAWNVGYVNSKLAKNQPALIHLSHEPLEDRIYSCLIKWKGSADRAGNVTIQDVRFNRKCNIREPNQMVWVRHDDMWVPRGDAIEFAVSNQQVIRNGELVPIVTICNQFGDLRHIIHMPNLNPNEEIYKGEMSRSKTGYRPRQYFGKDQHGDIWLGEEAFLRDGTLNLLRTALRGPVFLDFPPDVNERVLSSTLEREGYQQSGGTELLSEGKWRFVHRGPQTTVLEIFFKRNVYGWTMIGLTRDRSRIICLAINGNPGRLRKGRILEKAAEYLLTEFQAYNALLIDEGADVFQYVLVDGHLKEMVKRYRNRIRATFIMARRRM